MDNFKLFPAFRISFLLEIRLQCRRFQRTLYDGYADDLGR